ncbi:MAG TPA: UvrD-helicase domain-containing protein [Dehalococcoidia bacterium]|nr:UvrD-helicase domain-containing protein [Dehalococcoidia bacterium]
MTVVDYEAQDEGVRRLISEALDEMLFVEAGAGTGKTRALVERFVALVRSGREVDRIVAITFTEKAAAELRERVRSALETDGSEEAATALAALDRAQISTIHAFAQSLLKTFSAQAGVDPDFEVQDEVTAERRLQDRWRSALVELGNVPQAVAAIDKVLSLGMFPNEIERLATELTEKGALAEVLHAQRFAAPDPVWPDLAGLQTQLEAVLAGAPDDCRLTHRLHAVKSGIVAVGNARPGDRETALAAVASKFAGSYSGDKRKWGGGAARDAALSLCQEVSAEMTGLLAGLRSAALAELMPYIVAFVRQEERARAKEGALTFDDLILRVRDVLRDNDGARRAFRERYDALLIDEFQDTDPLQMEIALGFAQDPESGALEPGRLFLVGDPKQSIYRFRRADMEMYSQTKSALEAAGSKTPELAHNQRSRPEILTWVNKVFRPLIGEGDEPAVQPPYRDIYPRREIPLKGPGVAWMQPADPGLPARDMRANEAQAIAIQCRRAIEEGWQVQERNGEVREATFADIAILIPRRILLSPLESQLAAARIPYRVEGGSLVYRTQEVRDIINCVTAIDDPADEVAIVGALRSPAFACSDVDLARFVADGGRFNYFHRALDEKSGPVADGLRALREYHEERHDSSLAGLVERVVWERGIVESGTLAQGDRNAFRRARFVIEQARKFEAAKPESVRAFVAWLERQAGRMIVDHEGTGIDDDEDAVRIMTVHGAKGLEFPIVILAGLAAAPNTGNYPVFLADYARGRVGVQIGSVGANRVFQLGDYATLNQTERAHEAAEMDRLAYVAATRARDHLLVSLSYSLKSPRGCIGHRLTVYGAREHAPELAPPDRLRVNGYVEPLAGLQVDLPPDGPFGEAREALVSSAIQKRFTSATGLKREADDAPEEKGREDESEPWSRGRAGTRVGRAVHAAIQSLPLDPDDATIEAFARAQAVAEAVPQRAGDVARLVRWVVRESEAWKRAIAAPRAMRETPFAVALDGRVVEGFVDLLIETPDGIEIVDWKTDQVPEAEVEARLRAYGLQAGLYVHGIQEATGRAVNRVTYVFASAKAEMSPGEPRTLAEAALAGLQASG